MTIETDGTRYKKVSRKGETLFVKTLDNNSEVHRHGRSYYAYNSDGKYLGEGSEAEAVMMAHKGFVNHVENGSDLSLWVAWNDAVNSGATVLEDVEEKTQFIVFGSGIGQAALEVKEDIHGWDIEIISINDLWKIHKDPNWEMLALTIAKTPFVLE